METDAKTDRLLAENVDQYVELCQTGYRHRPLNVQHVLQTVCQEFSVLLSDLKSRTRTRNLIFPRQVAYWLLYKGTTLSYSLIGEVLGNRDHSTIMAGVARINDIISNGEHDGKVATKLLGQIRRGDFQEGLEA